MTKFEGGSNFSSGGFFMRNATITKIVTTVKASQFAIFF